MFQWIVSDLDLQTKDIIKKLTGLTFTLSHRFTDASYTKCFICGRGLEFSVTVFTMRTLFRRKLCGFVAGLLVFGSVSVSVDTW